MKKVIICLTALALLATPMIPSAEAGSKQRHRWEGFALGVGAAFLTSAFLLHPPFVWAAPRPVAVAPAPVHRPRPVKVVAAPAPVRPVGHWAFKKAWIPPKSKRVWRPGHFTNRRVWVPGKWNSVGVKPGRWARKRVWVK